jgi:hypothetical protein
MDAIVAVSFLFFVVGVHQDARDWLISSSRKIENHFGRCIITFGDLIIS